MISEQERALVKDALARSVARAGRVDEDEVRALAAQILTNEALFVGDDVATHVGSRWWVGNWPIALVAARDSVAARTEMAALLDIRSYREGVAAGLVAARRAVESKRPIPTLEQVES